MYHSLGSRAAVGATRSRYGLSRNHLRQARWSRRSRVGTRFTEVIDGAVVKRSYLSFERILLWRLQFLLY